MGTRLQQRADRGCEWEVLVSCWVLPALSEGFCAEGMAVSGLEWLQPLKQPAESFLVREDFIHFSSWERRDKIQRTPTADVMPSGKLLF